MGLQILNTDLPVIIVQPFPNFPVPIAFGYATGGGDQEGCARVEGWINVPLSQTSMSGFRF